MRSLLKNFDENTKLFTVSANTQIMSKVAGDRWASVGDAAWSADPLSSQGMLKAIKSGINVARIINDDCKRGESSASDYESDTKKEFHSYLNSRSNVYRIEGRWKNEKFWARRHVFNWLEIPINLSPEQIINPDIKRSLKSNKRIKQIVPAVNFDRLVNAIKASSTVYEAAESYRKIELGCVSDKEIIIAIQELLN